MSTPHEISEDLIIKGMGDMYKKLLVGKSLTRFGKNGKKISERIEQQEKYSMLNKARDITNLEKTFEGMTKKEAFNFSDVAEGKAKPISPKVVEAVKVWDKTRTMLADLSAKNKLTIKNSKGIEIPFTPRENYIPYMLKPIFFGITLGFVTLTLSDFNF